MIRVIFASHDNDNVTASLVVLELKQRQVRLVRHDDVGQLTIIQYSSFISTQINRMIQKLRKHMSEEAVPEDKFAETKDHDVVVAVGLHHLPGSRAYPDRGKVAVPGHSDNDVVLKRLPKQKPVSSSPARSSTAALPWFRPRKSTKR